MVELKILVFLRQIFKIIQFTGTHLFKDDQFILGVNSRLLLLML